MNTSKPDIRCRFAPSPTGDLHVGGARTALFNYLFAKSLGGTFVLRIEDTDLQRSTKEAVSAIFDGLKWLGIDYDEGPFFQTERFSLYRHYAQQLLSAGHAYRCYSSAEELEAVRKEQMARGDKPQYNKKYRPATVTSQPQELPTTNDEQPFVIRIRCPEDGVTSFDDQIVGNVSTANKEIDDFVIVRSDGSPTYNFTVVIDDIDMKISHVIRGMDHISNTPKQILIYQALGSAVPQFAHVPMILGADKKKLSKRHGATSVVEYRNEGYLADAFLNYIARLGWGHGDQEIFSRAELCKLFSLNQVGKSPAVFDFDKLNWVNMEHIKSAPLETLLSEVTYFFSRKGLDSEKLLKNPAVANLINSLRERSKTTKEMAEQCSWLLFSAEQLEYDQKAVEKHLTSEIKPALSVLIEKLSASDDFSESSLEKLFHLVIEQQQIKLGKLAQPVRVALTGSSVSPPIYTVLEVLGKEESLKRLNSSLSKLK